MSRNPIVRFDSRPPNFYTIPKTLVFTLTLIKFTAKHSYMKSRVLINFAVTQEQKAAYIEACDVLGVSLSDICRKALDQAVIVAETLESSPPSTEAEAIQ